MKAADLPDFIKAESPRGLRLAMLKNNIKHSMTIHYFDIQFVDGSWYAWYYIDVKHDDELVSNGVSEE